MQAKLESVTRLNNILRIYGECSGQCVNRDKSSIFFSPNTPHPVRVMLKGATGIAVEAFNERYLGLPTAIGRITSGTFDFIRERVKSKMNGGAERLVSCVVREVLIKSKALVVPAHKMSCFKLTKKCTQIYFRRWQSFGGAVQLTGVPCN